MIFSCAVSYPGLARRRRLSSRFLAFSSMPHFCRNQQRHALRTADGQRVFRTHSLKNGCHLRLALHSAAICVFCAQRGSPLLPDRLPHRQSPVKQRQFLLPLPVSLSSIFRNRTAADGVALQLRPDHGETDGRLHVFRPSRSPHSRKRPAAPAASRCKTRGSAPTGWR